MLLEKKMKTQIKEAVQLPYSLYQDLLNHLQIHAATDEWANSLLERLTDEAKPVAGELESLSEEEEEFDF